MGALIRSELSAIIFTKATRRKDVKHVAKSKTLTASTTKKAQAAELEQPISATSKDSSLVEDLKEEDEEAAEEDSQKSRQATINLIGRMELGLNFWLC